MNTVKIRNTVIGEGMPKICVPVVGVTREEILEEARAVTCLPADIVEWRADWFGNIFDPGELENVLKELREILGNMPVLMTFRSSGEGGQKDIGTDEYADINIRAAQTGLADMVDAELSAGDETVKRIIKGAHAAGVKVIVSSHDFLKTPDKDIIVERLRKMQDLGADITKIAVMPQSRKDVLTLLAAAEEMAAEYADRPFIAISMSDTGVISRLTGEVFGSALTFGAASKTSAPGQIGAEELKDILTAIHKVL